MGAGTAPNYYAEKVADAVWQAEAKVSKANYGAVNLSSNQLKTRASAGVLRRFAMQTGHKIVTRAVPGVGTFMFGWEIGSGINKLFVDVDADPIGPSTPPQYVELFFSNQPRWANTSGWSDGLAPQDEPIAPGGALAARFRFNGYSVTTNLQTGDACQDMRPSPARFRVAHGSQYGRCAAVAPTAAYYWEPEDLIVSTRPATTPPDHWGLYSGWGGWVGDKVTQDFPPLPSSTQVEQAARAQLDSDDGGMQRALWKWVTDTLPAPADPVWQDPSYQPPTLDPTQDDAPLGRTTVPVGLGSSQPAYEQLAKSRDLTVAFVETDGYDYDYLPDAVVETTPAPGTRVERGTTIEVAVNPHENPGSDEQPTDNNRRCERSAPNNRDPFPEMGNDASSVDQRMLWWTPYREYQRLNGSGDLVNVMLGNGNAWFEEGAWQGWGYRKIFAKHGYSADDELATVQALLQPSTRSTNPKFPYRWFHNGLSYQLNGAICRRRVVVEERTKGTPFPGREQGIVSSWGQYVEEAPE